MDRVIEQLIESRSLLVNAVIEAERNGRVVSPEAVETAKRAEEGTFADLAARRSH